MKRTIFILVFLLTFKCYAQDGKSLLKQGGLIFLQAWVATPIDSTRYKLEIYAIIKEPFLFYEDTLYKEPKFGDLVGDSLTLKCWNNKYYYESFTKRGKTLRDEFKSVDSCDKSINYIKNGALRHQIWSSTHDTARKYIGHSNKEYTMFERTHDVYSKIDTICHFNYKKPATVIEQELYDEIHRVYDKKIARYNWFKQNINIVDTTVIHDFIDSFDDCETDLKTLYIIILNKPKLFLQACDKLNKDDFFYFSLRINYIPETTELLKVIAELEKPENKSARKNKIIRCLNRRVISS